MQQLHGEMQQFHGEMQQLHGEIQQLGVNLSGEIKELGTTYSTWRDVYQISQNSVCCLGILQTLHLEDFLSS